MILILYKLRKLFREKGQEIIRLTLALSFACAGSFLIALPILFTDDMDKKEKAQMCATFLFAGFVSTMSLLYVDTFQINIIFKIIVSILLSFVLFLPIIFILMVYVEYKSVVLNKSEEREAKLLGILRKNGKNNN